MNDIEFDRALVAAAFAEAGETGWHRVGVASAARRAGLDLARARARFAGRPDILIRFGELADMAAVEGISTDTPLRDTLFDMLMRRIDMLQEHRAGVLALFRMLAFNPPLAAMFAAASLRSMIWLLDAAGGPVTRWGPLSLLRAKGLLAVWLWTVRAWQRDETTDLSPTMAALDQALARAEKAANWVGGRREDPAPESTAEPTAPPPE